MDNQYKTFLMETNNKGMAQRAPTASAPHLRQEYDNNSVTCR